MEAMDGMLVTTSISLATIGILRADLQSRPLLYAVVGFLLYAPKPKVTLADSCVTN